MRLTSLLAVAALVPVLATCASASDPVAPPGPAATSPSRGAALYAGKCALCHGAKGEGYAADRAPRLAGQELLSQASDDFLRAAIAEGRPGTTMGAWSRARGGPFSDDDTNAVLAFMRTWQKVPRAQLDMRPATGDAARGTAKYDAECRSCHGERGKYGTGVQLANAVFQRTASDGYLRAAIVSGRPGTPMPAFGARLAPAEVDDVIVALRTFMQPPPPVVPDLPPRPGGLVDVVINPGGPEPDFDPTAAFIPVDVVKAALDKGATLVLADARSPGEYAANHIARAISVPFYEAADYLPQIPKERFVVTYCACPHAASGKSAEVFRANGYTRVAVLDEGVDVWRERGYTMRSGAKP